MPWRSRSPCCRSWRPGNGTSDGTSQIDDIGTASDGTRSPAMFGGPAAAVVASKVHAGTAGGPTMAADYTLAFHRLYSDINGDGISDNADLFQMRSTYLKPSTDPAYKWYFDYNGDGIVDNADVFQLRGRRSKVFQGY